MCLRRMNLQVAVQRIHEDFCVKIVSVDKFGHGIEHDAPLGMSMPQLPMLTAK